MEAREACESAPSLTVSRHPRQAFRKVVDGPIATIWDEVTTSWLHAPCTLEPTAADKPLRMRIPSHRAIVVFGAATQADGRPSPKLEARLEAALDEAVQDPAAILIVSGGPVTGPAEGPLMAEWLSARGVDPARIIVEPKARYTLDNAERVAPLVAACGAREVTLVTSDSHMPRSLGLLRKELARVVGSAVTVRPRRAKDDAGGEPLRTLRLLEIRKTMRDLSTQARKWRAR